jgi:hypothetical protein
LICHGKWSASGANASSNNEWKGSKSFRGVGARRDFPPRTIVDVKALACELPHQLGLPLGHWSIPELKREVVRRGWVASIGETTLWRWLSEDAIRPWCHRSWIFPRDPDFLEKASRVLDLYQGLWYGSRLDSADCVLSADEKTSIQARQRRHAIVAPASGRAMRVEHEYKRRGAWAYLAAWDVRRGKIHGRCARKTGIAPFGRLVNQVMTQEPYRSAPRVFWILDNGSSHRGWPCRVRLQSRWSNLIVVHTPVHASWLNQIEIYFSILQRKLLTPNDFYSLARLRAEILDFQRHYEAVAKPFEWKFTRRDLARLMRKLEQHEKTSLVAA